jgi:hypothetical protein
MRTALLTIMVALPALAAVLMLVLTITYRRFRRLVPELRTAEDLQRLRSLAKLHMYLSLLGHPVLTVAGVLAIWAVGWLVVRELEWLDLLLYGIVPIVVTLVIAAWGQSPARMAKAIPTSDVSLAVERDHIVDVWINRLFPDW